MNTAINRFNGQIITDIDNDLISRYNIAFWIINPTVEQIEAVNTKVETIVLREKLRKIGKQYVDIVLAEFLNQISANPEAVQFLDNLLGQAKIHMNQGEFISARDYINSIPVSMVFSVDLKNRFLDELQGLIDAYYPSGMVN